MGTNYYVHIKFHIDDAIELIHLGKFSCGWVFCFHYYPGKVENFEQAKELCKQGEIYDEYERLYSLEEFLEEINSNKDKHNKHSAYCKQIDGYDWMEGEWF